MSSVYMRTLLQVHIKLRKCEKCAKMAKVFRAHEFCVKKFFYLLTLRYYVTRDAYIKIE